MFGSNPQTQGLLGAAAAILQASGPSLRPVSFGQVLGAGIQGLQQGQQDALQRMSAQQQSQLLGLKIKDAESDVVNQQLLRERQKRIAQRLTGGAQAPALGDQDGSMASAMPSGAMSPKLGGPDWLQAYQQQNGLQLASSAPGAAPRMNQTDAYVQRMMTIAQAHADEGDIDGATKIYEQVQKLRPKFSNDVTWVRSADGKQVGLRLADDGSNSVLDGYSEQQDPNKAFSIGADGKPLANSAFQTYELSKAKAGATNVTTKVENKAAESIASQVGPMLKSSAEQAVAAVGQIDASNRILQALGTGKLYTGPLASQRLSVAQLGQTLGVGGTDDAEKIANTRQLVRGLAEMTLQGRKQMQGQGQITDQESRLAEKATSGDIDSMTAQELRIIAQASQRAAKYTVAAHQAKLAKARGNAATAGIADYFDTPVIPSALGTPPAPSNGQLSVTTPDGRTWSFKDAKSLANFKLEAGIR